MPSHRLFYLLLTAIKWPLAFLSVMYFPSMAWALWQEIFLDVSTLAYVFLGSVCYGVVWWFTIQHWRVGWLSTLEHELTHCLFAWLTGNKVGEIKVTLRDGGHMTYTGSPNWLIDVAPYFFPICTFLLLLIAPLFPSLNVIWYQLAIGISMAYHITSTFTETHPGQTDLQKAGFVFCWMFLPTANLACLGLTLAGAREGWSGISNWFGLVYAAPWNPSIWQSLGNIVTG